MDHDNVLFLFIGAPNDATVIFHLHPTDIFQLPKLHAANVHLLKKWMKVFLPQNCLHNKYPLEG